MLAHRTNLYTRSVKAYLLPALSGMQPSPESLASDIFSAVIAATSIDEQEPDIDLAYSEARDAEIDALDDRLFVYEHVLGLAIAGLFLLWERAMRRVLIRAIRFRLPVPDGKITERADMMLLLEALNSAGNGAPPSVVVQRLNELRLVANIVKHGAGASLRDLAEQYPDRFDGLPAHLATPELLSLTEDDLLNFGENIATFWRSVAPTAE